jgi:hypothetical protein
LREPIGGKAGRRYNNKLDVGADLNKIVFQKERLGGKNSNIGLWIGNVW